MAVQSDTQESEIETATDPFVVITTDSVEARLVGVDKVEAFFRQVDEVDQISAQQVDTFACVVRAESAVIIQRKDFGVAKRDLAGLDRLRHGRVDFDRRIAGRQADAEARVGAQSVPPKADDAVDPGDFGIEAEKVHWKNWSVGVLEKWATGIWSIAPVLHHSITPSRLCQPQIDRLP